MPGIHPRHLRDYVIRPALGSVGLWSEDAERLLLGTAAVESQLGYYLAQVGGGPALGIWQMEPATHHDHWETYINAAGHSVLRLTILRIVNMGDALPGKSWSPPKEFLIMMPHYAAVMARIHYRRVPSPLPTTVEGDAEYWKANYNTHLGKGTVEGYLKAWETLVEGRL